MMSLSFYKLAAYQQRQLGGDWRHVQQLFLACYFARLKIKRFYL
jgi:hypothetical protein